MNLSKHIENATGIYKNTYNKLDKWQRAKEDEGQRLKEESEKLTNEAANEAYNAFVAKYAEQLQAITETHDAELEGVKQAYFQEVKEFYAPNGANIDNDDKALLESNILTAEEFSEMVVKHSENPTMLRIMSKYSKAFEKEVETKIRRALSLAAKAGEKEKLVLYSYIQLMNAPIIMASQGTAGTEMFLQTALKADEYTEKAKAEVVMTKLFLTEDDEAALKAYNEKVMEDQNRARAKAVEF